jgi:Raf kinase inhibitor-like YbhB/YbcL family protein
MKFFSLFLTAVIFVAMTSFTSRQSLTVSSKAFKNNDKIPSEYSCEGKESSPPLTVSNIPREARSLALIVHDPDAPMKGGFTHWVVWDIETSGDIPENYKGGEQGMNSASQPGYKGMCPPSGEHHYHFYVYALDTKLNLGKQTSKAALEKAMHGHILAEGHLVGLYAKGGK